MPFLGTMKNKFCLSTIVFLGLLVIGLASCGETGTKGKEGEIKADSMNSALYKRALTIFQELPKPGDPTTPKAVLGKKLYFETALSINNKLSCNSCHMLDKFGVDNLPTSPGHEGKLGERNSPTVYNASFHIAQFWDGRAADLTEQAKGPILNPVEMGMPDEKTAVTRIKAIPEYAPLFSAAFPNEKEAVNYQNIATAIAAFESTLTTPAPFDAFLAGNQSALSQEQKQGLDLFINKACITCHMGPGLGGNMYQKFGLVKGPYWDYTHSTRQDRGRAEVTKNEGDAYFFKVPSLRNVAKTAPYFHDGSVGTLQEAVSIMANTQLGQELSPDEISAIVAFLEALTGEIPEHAKEPATMNH